MDVTEACIAGVPAANLRVARGELADVWRRVESLHDALLPNPMDRNAVAGIATVCRWLAGVYPLAPVTGRRVVASPWVVEAECRAVLADLAADPVPVWLLNPAGWATGVIAALDWAWKGGDLPTVRHVHGVPVFD